MEENDEFADLRDIEVEEEAERIQVKMNFNDGQVSTVQPCG